MMKFLNNIAMILLVLFVLGVNRCYATVLTDSSGDVITDSSNNPVSDTAGPPLLAPGIATEPLNQTVNVSATATFSVVAVGNPMPTYRWQQEAPGATTFTAIIGATASNYTTPPVTAANNHTEYECVVSSTLGIVTSTVATLFVNTAPSIITQPVSQSVVAAQTASFSVLASGVPTPTYQWQQEAVGASSFTNIPGATSATYTTPATTISINGTKYVCIISNSAGSVTTTPVTLTVSSAPSVPSITTQPVNATVTSPSTATFTVVASGTPTPTYQWKQQVSILSGYTAIIGATSSSYTTPATTTANSGTKYECVITNSQGSVTSNPVVLTVNPAPTAPVITTQPFNVTVTAPATANFSVTAAGTPAPSYQWLQEAPGATTFTMISGATASTYSTSATTTSMSGTKYECVITNTLGTVTSNPAILTVNPAPSLPTITTQPVNATIVTGQIATFTVVATGTPAPSYQWQQEVSGATSFTNISLATSASYSLLASTIAASGVKYRCVVTNSVGSVTSTSATLIVNPASGLAVSITSPLNNATFTAPASITFTTNIVDPVASVTQVAFYNGSNLLGYGSIQPPYAGFTFKWNGVVSGAYTITAKATDSKGNKASSAAVSITVASHLPPTVSLANPSSTTSSPFGLPTSTIFYAPASMVLTATATATNATITKVSFYYNGTNLIGSTTTGSTGFLPILGASSNYTYTWTKVPAATYTLTAIATDSTGLSTTSAPVTVTVNPYKPPTINITSPKNNVNYTLPASITLSASMTAGSGSITQVAFYNGTTMLGNAGKPSAGLLLTGLNYSTTWTPTSLANYSIVAQVTDSTGTVTSSAPVNISITLPQIAPSITTQPTNTTVIAPATATFTVAATGTPAPSYQWQQEAPGASSYTAISGATSASYTTPATTTANSGTLYQCVVNNAAGIVTSNAVTLTVNSVTSYIQNISYNANGQITQIQYGNGTTTAYTYNPLNFRLMRIYTSNAQAQVIQDLNYTYDSVGQVLSIVDNVNTGNNSMNQTFTYDALNRLTSAAGTYGNKAYAYDSIGNVTQKEGLTYNYGEANSRINASGTVIGNAGPHAVTSLSDGTVFKYDANGNMVSLQKASNTTQYAYDTQNRLQTVTVGGVTAASYTYDGDGGRTQKTVYRRDLALYNDNTNVLLFGSLDNPLPATAANPTVDTTIDVGNLYETESGTTRNTKFIYLGSTRVASLDNSGNIFYYHTDHLGGTNVLTDQTGAVREFTTYDPFGQVFTHEKYGNNFATAWYYFSGKPLDDETGLIYLGARYYNPALGRFITPDTVVQAAGNPQTLNRYTYCNNNPVNLVDPSGHSWWSKLWKSITHIFESFVKAVIEAVAYTILSPILTPVGAGLLVGFVAGGLGNGGGWSWSGALMGGALGAVGGAAFGSNGVNGFLGSAGRAVGLGLIGAGAVYSGITGGVEGVLNFGAGVAGGMVGYAAGSAINKALAGTTAGQAIQEGQQVQRSSGSNTPISQEQTPQSNLTVSQGENVSSGQALNQPSQFQGQLLKTSVAYRYVGEAEANGIEQSGLVPNTDGGGNFKGVYYTSDAPFDSASAAKAAYNLTTMPSYRVTIMEAEYTSVYVGKVVGGTGVEKITYQQMTAVRVDKLNP